MYVLTSPRSKTLLILPITAFLLAFVYSKCPIIRRNREPGSGPTGGGGKAEIKAAGLVVFCARLDLVNTGKEGGVRNSAEMRPSELRGVIGCHILLLLYVHMSKHEHQVLAANEGARWHNATPQKTQTQQVTPLGNPTSLSQETTSPMGPFLHSSWLLAVALVLMLVLLCAPGFTAPGLSVPNRNQPRPRLLQWFWGARQGAHDDKEKHAHPTGKAAAKATCPLDKEGRRRLEAPSGMSTAP